MYLQQVQKCESFFKTSTSQKWDTFTNELLLAKKHNLATLMKDKAFQLYFFSEFNGYLPFAM